MERQRQSTEREREWSVILGTPWTQGLVGQEFSFGLLPIVDTPNSARHEDDGVKTPGAITIRVGSSSPGTSPGSLGPAQCTEQTPDRSDRAAAQLRGAAGGAKQLAAGDTEAPSQAVPVSDLLPPLTVQKGLLRQRIPPGHFYLWPLTSLLPGLI